MTSFSPQNFQEASSILSIEKAQTFDEFMELFNSIEIVNESNMLNSINGRKLFEAKVSFDEMTFEEAVYAFRDIQNNKIHKNTQKTAKFAQLKERILRREYILDELCEFLDDFVSINPK